MTFVNWFKQFLTQTVVEDRSFDRPFRLRRVSLLMIIIGWLTFFASCMIGLWIMKHGYLAGYRQLFSLFTGTAEDADRFGSLTVQTLQKLFELAGAGLFVGGMASVALFDKSDAVTDWRAD